MWRIVRIILAVYLIVNLVLAFVFWPRIDQFLRFMPRVKPATYTQPVNTLEAQRQDLSYLETILNYDRSFSEASRREFKSRIEELNSRSQELSPAAFYMTVRELMALADNGHTGVTAGPAFKNFNRSGVDIYPFSDGYYVVRAHKDYGGLLGRKVTAIDGRPIEDVVLELRPYFGGSDNWRDQQSLLLLKSPELLHAVGLANGSKELTYTVETADGGAIDKTIVAFPAAVEMNYYRHAFMTLSPGALGEEANDWVRTLQEDLGEIAPYLTEMSNNVLSQKIGNGLYVRSNYLLGSSENPIKAQLLDTLKPGPENGYNYLVVDLRWNPGGDYGNAVPFAKEARSTLSDDGKIYVVTGPNTFSAAIVFTALLKQYAPEQTLIIGEQIGDRPQFWAERGKPFVLPNSNYWINYSTGFHDWDNGCANTHKYCFPPNKKWDRKIDGLQVDYKIMPSYDDYASGRDIVLDWVLAREGK